MAPRLEDEGESFDAADKREVTVSDTEMARLEQEALDRLAEAGWTDG